MLTLANIIYQMNDGIHSVNDFLVVDDAVHYVSPKDRTLDLARQLMPVPRDSFIEAVEKVTDDWEVMESLYGKYNSYAMEPGTSRYYAWYDNDR